jgi:hypothetical protein
LGLALRYAYLGRAGQSPSRGEAGAHLVNLPTTAYVFTDGVPQGWVEVALSAGGATLVLHCVDPKHEKHGEKIELKWRT